MTGKQVKIKTALISNEEQKDTVQMSGHSLLYLINMCHFPTFSFRPFLDIHMSMTIYGMLSCRPFSLSPHVYDVLTCSHCPSSSPSRVFGDLRDPLDYFSISIDYP